MTPANCIIDFVLQGSSGCNKSALTQYVCHALSPDALSPHSISPRALSPRTLSPDGLSENVLSSEKFWSKLTLLNE